MSKPPRRSKTYRLRVGRLADGREAFAKAGYCISALGDYRFVEVWVRNRRSYGGAQLYRERNHAPHGSPGYREMSALVKGTDRRIPGMMPIRICQRLGWTR
jgi:hypothetical protein